MNDDNYDDDDNTDDDDCILLDLKMNFIFVALSSSLAL